MRSHIRRHIYGFDVVKLTGGVELSVDGTIDTKSTINNRWQRRPATPHGLLRRNMRVSAKTNHFDGQRVGFCFLLGSA